MGAFKQRTGKTRVGKALQSVGGFFSNIFKRKPETGNDSNNPTPNNALPSNTATSGGGGGNGSGWSDLLIGIGGVVGVWLGNKAAENNGNYSTDPYIYQRQLEQEQDQKQGIGQNVIVGIVLLILSVAAYLFFRKK